MRKQILISIVLFQSVVFASPLKVKEARKYFLNKDYKKAHGELSDVLRDQLDSRQTALVELFQGLVFFKQKNYQFAVEYFYRSLGQDLYLQDIVHYYLGLAYLGLNKYPLARQSFKKVNKLNSSEFLKRQSQFYLAEILFEKKKYNQAGKIFKKLERKMKRSEFYPDILWFLVKINNAKKKKKSVCYWSRKLYTRYPTYQPVAHWGLSWKTNLLDGHPLNCKDKMRDQRSRVRRLQWLGASEKILKEIKYFEKMEKNKFVSTNVLVEYLLGEGMVKEAFDRLKPYYKYKKRRRDEDYVKLFARAASKSNEYHVALDVYLRAHKDFSGQKSIQFLYSAAFLGYKYRDYDGALKRFGKIQSKYPRTFFARRSYWYIPWIYYLKGNHQKSFDLMEMALKRKIRGMNEERLRYWMAMNLERLGHKKRAGKLFLKISQDESIGYYSIAAVQRLRELLSPKPLTSLQYNDSLVLRENWLTYQNHKKENFDSDLFQTKVSEIKVLSSGRKKLPFIKGFLGLEENFSASSEINGSELLVSIKRAKDLSLIGLTDLAKWELYGLEEKTRNKEILRALMFEYYRNNLFHRSAYIGSQHFSNARKHLGLHLGAALWQFVYPRAFEEEVLKNGKNFNVSPEFVWSIMKAETNFRPDAISPVGARGLMQIMTSTGKKVASLMGKNIEGPELFHPSVGVEIGTRYLKRVLKKFQNKIPLAAAAYNGGPHRVHKWLHQFGQLEMDEFIEHIPFSETRSYVKKVIRYYTLYNLLYNKDGQASSWLADNVGVYPEGTPPTRETWEAL